MPEDRERLRLRAGQPSRRPTKATFRPPIARSNITAANALRISHCQDFLPTFLVALLEVRGYHEGVEEKSGNFPLTREMSQTEIVTLAVYILGGDQRSIDTEDIAVKAHDLAPGRFSWRKYPEHINLELVRVYLSDAKKTDKGEMLSGSGKTGWRLTQKGLLWCREVSSEGPLADLSRGRSQSRAGSVDEQRWRRERARILNSQAWASWQRGNRDIPVSEASTVYRIDSYAVGDLRETKITRLMSLFSEDPEIAPFLSYLADVINSEGVRE